MLLLVPMRTIYVAEPLLDAGCNYPHRSGRSPTVVPVASDGESIGTAQLRWGFELDNTFVLRMNLPG